MGGGSPKLSSSLDDGGKELGPASLLLYTPCIGVHTASMHLCLCFTIFSSAVSSCETARADFPSPPCFVSSSSVLSPLTSLFTTIERSLTSTDPSLSLRRTTISPDWSPGVSTYVRPRRTSSTICESTDSVYCPYDYLQSGLLSRGRLSSTLARLPLPHAFTLRSRL